MATGLWLFEGWIALSTGYIAIQWTGVSKTYYADRNLSSYPPFEQTGPACCVVAKYICTLPLETLFSGNFLPYKLFISVLNTFGYFLPGPHKKETITCCIAVHYIITNSVKGESAVLLKVHHLKSMFGSCIYSCIGSCR